ncbi:phosphoglycerate kinase [Candidatus Woesearchaeota archaeon]|nr:phosphoglycerate kinase [Candidatus Woesearchaeota archaeon]
MRSIKEVKVGGKTVLLRVDFNVPLRQGKVANDERIRAALPTINWLRKNKAKVVILSHLGRPEGKVVEEYRLKPVAEHLQKILKQPVHYALDCIGSEVEDTAKSLHECDIMLLENVRFYQEEEQNNENFAQKLASIANIYCNDAFGVSHRAHASVHAITHYLPSYAGFLLQKEINSLETLLKQPKRPYIAILGGAKVSDKIGVIQALLKKVDALLIGGAMMFTFFKALGHEVGKSKVEEEKTTLAKELLKSKKIILPTDIMVKTPNGIKNVPAGAIPKNSIGLDIGKETQAIYAEILTTAKTLFWNGPLGLCEQKPFDKGTTTIAKAIPKKAFSVVGGGDTVSIIEKLKLDKKFSHVSTGGGASLEYVEGKKLPGIDALN